MNVGTDIHWFPIFWLCRSYGICEKPAALSALESALLFIVKHYFDSINSMPLLKSVEALCELW